MEKKNKNSKNTWTKVKYLKTYMKIATPADEALGDFGFDKNKALGQAREGDIVWDEIVSIKKVGREKVYDIEVEGAHNFVAGHLIDRETGEKLSPEEEKKILQRSEERRGGKECRSRWSPDQ